MALSINEQFVLSVAVTVFLYNSCAAIKCFDCNSANNSACLDMHMPKMHSIVPVVDCSEAVPHIYSKNLFCRKISQTVLHAEKTPEVRVTRGCGWVKHHRACYKADNEDHLETVCQCFGDMCNAATLRESTAATLASAAILVTSRIWRRTV